MTDPKLKPLILGVSDTGTMLCIGRTKINDLLRKGSLTAIKIGRRTLITMESIESLVAIGQDKGSLAATKAVPSYNKVRPVKSRQRKSDAEINTAGDLEATLPKASSLQRVLSNNPDLSQIELALSDPTTENPPCSYLCLADRMVCSRIGVEIARQANEMRERGQLAAIRLFHNQEPSWESNGQEGELRPKQIVKASSPIKKHSPHSVSIISSAVAPVEGEPGWNFTWLVSTLELIVGDHAENSLPPPRPIARTSTAAYGERPRFPPETVYVPTKEDIERLVYRLMNMSDALHRACVVLAKDGEGSAWRRQWRARAMGAFAAKLLIPLKDSMFASGHGTTILKVALTAPTARAAEGKKNGALTRDRMAYLIWADAIKYNRSIPPFVEI